MAGGLTPDFAAKLNALIAASGGKVHLVSGYRSVAQQQALWDRAIAKYGSATAARKWVAPPGASNHNHGVAADLGGDLKWVAANAARFGLALPMGHEPWHVEPTGQRAKSSPHAYTPDPSLPPMKAQPSVTGEPDYHDVDLQLAAFNDILRNPIDFTEAEAPLAPKEVTV